MIVYSATKAQFCETVRENRIGQTILDAFRQHLGHNPSPSEAQAFQNSLNYVGNMLHSPSIPSDAGVAVEYKIPQSSKRIDFIVTGFNEEDKPVAIVIELKQWTDVETTPKDAIVRTWVGGAEREVLHPSYQAWSYAQFMTDFNEFVDHHHVRLHPCAYLHNCHDETGVRSPFYWEHLGRAPVFLGDESKDLENFIATHVRKGDRGDLLYKLDKGKIRPSKSLTDHLGSLLKGNKEFVMIDEQKLVFEAAIHLSTSATTGNRKVLIVRGGPGTGKSVVAVNLLVELSSRGKLVQYVTRNAAPREVYRSKLAGTIKRTRIDNLFKNSGFYQTCKAGELDVLVVDEAHRLTEKSGLYMNEGENQIKEVIEASKLTVFFLDEDQRVTINDIGTGDEIVRWADHFNADVSELELPSQFRCNGESGYISFLDQLLQIRPTANTTLEGINYDFRVMRNPSELREAIFQQRTAALSLADVEKCPLVVLSVNAVRATDNEAKDIFQIANSTVKINADFKRALLASMSNAPGYLKSERELALATKCLALEDSSSPFFQKVVYQGVKYAKGNKPPVAYNSLFAVVRMFAEGALRDFMPDAKTIAEVVKRTYTIIQKTWPSDWGMTTTKSRLMHGAGMRAMGHLILKKLGDKLPDFNGNILDESMWQKISESVSRLKEHLIWSDDAFAGAPKAVKEFYKENIDGVQNTPTDISKLTGKIEGLSIKVVHPALSWVEI